MFLSTESADPVRAMFEPDMKKQNVALWASLNQSIISGGDDGAIRIWDVETGVQTSKIVEHKKQINNIQFSKDHTMFITCSSDHTAKVLIRCVKTV